MQFTIIVALLAGLRDASACVPSLHPRRMTAKAGHGMEVERRDTIVSSSGEDNTTQWTVSQNMQVMQVSDDAFIAKDLARFNHAPSVIVYYQSGVTMNYTEHIQDMRLTYSIYSDIAPHNHNYKVLFGEGDWTFAISQARGRNDGPVYALDGSIQPPSMREVAFDLMTVVRWKEGLMYEEYLFSDVPTLYRQLQLLPNMPPVDAPDIMLDPYTTPLTTQPAVDHTVSNKAKTIKSTEALNSGNFTAASLYLSPNVKVYGLNDESYNTEQYLAWLSDFHHTFPDLHLTNQQLIAQGDWVGTIGKLSGTQKGVWNLPPYLASAPVSATNNTFNLLHYTVSRWQDGFISEIRINLDIIGIISALGIDL